MTGNVSDAGVLSGTFTKDIESLVYDEILYSTTTIPAMVASITATKTPKAVLFQYEEASSTYYTLTVIPGKFSIRGAGGTNCTAHRGLTSFNLNRYNNMPTSSSTGSARFINFKFSTLSATCGYNMPYSISINGNTVTINFSQGSSLSSSSNGISIKVYVVVYV